ncbi:HesA/MoeB/ThiF family protein [Polynucleobacter sp. HIN7]|uniref:HesA/MoeB/ThiF family protein n=1 Tax=Polynucleobacter sp. HIN7 TaxID=3047866 RepID=UPI002573DB07|nr:molybdopterin-synthase adenylyltransferase MoeB [Polynucleobacter sp. HIN7]BEI37954.1 molybdopterin-synthase adenylyltransferase MoeB [Polynucleobacter sp. HIN7]
MNDEQLLRYSRHLLLDEIDIVGQERLLSSHVLIIGAGGLGSACAPYLAAAGIGRITLIDHDHVELTNLQRQIMHQDNSIGMSKVASGKRFLKSLNPSCQVEALEKRLDEPLLKELLGNVDVVVDCTDNFSTRHLINRVCVTHGKVLVSGAALRFDGQVSVFDFSDPNSPCYACVFPPDPNYVETNCASMGVFAPLVGIIGTIQAAQTLQVIIGFGEPLIGRLLIWNARTTQIDEIKLARHHACPVCGPGTH